MLLTFPISKIPNETSGECLKRRYRTNPPGNFDAIQNGHYHTVVGVE